MLETKEIVIRDLLISYRQSVPSAEAPVAILLHGWRSDASAWGATMHFLDTLGYASYALDLPGFGSSETPRDTYGVDLYAGLVNEFMKKLRIQNAVLIGHSFGGRIAIVLAVKYASIVRKLVLVDSAGLREESMKLGIVKRIAHLVSPFFQPSFMQPVRRAIYRAMGAEDYTATPQMTGTFVKTISENLTSMLPQIRQETLLIWGESDIDTPITDAKKMSSLIPHARLEILPMAGHFSFMDAPGTFQTLLSSFLKNT